MGLDINKQAKLIALGLVQGLMNQQLQAGAIQGAKGYAPNARAIRMTESIVDLTNQLRIKTDNSDPLADLKQTLGLSVPTAQPAPSADDARLRGIEKANKVLNTKFDKLLNALNAPATP